MQNQMIKIDAHSHLALPKVQDLVPGWIHQGDEQGIKFYMQGGIDPQDWDSQIELEKKYPGKIGLCFGLHPYWIHQSSESEIEMAMEKLSRMLIQARGLGEVGIDLRPQYESSREKQIDWMREQFELALVAHKPLVLHVVHGHAEALRMLDFVGPFPRGGMVHSFSGSKELGLEYIRRGFLLSLGGPVARSKNQRIIETLGVLPLDFLLLESDSPDQPSEAYRGKMNPPQCIFDVAKVLAAAKNVTESEIFAMTSQNFCRVFGPLNNG